MPRVDRRSGIALIEVLAAMTILAIAVVALMQELMASADTGRLRAEREREIIAAEQVLLSLTILDDAALRRATGRAELHGYTVRLHSRIDGTYAVEIAPVGSPGRVLIRTVLNPPQPRTDAY